MRRLFVTALAVVLPAVIPSPAGAVSSRSWSASTVEAFSRGTLDGTAIDAEGTVRLAPEVRTVWGPADGIVWAVQPDGPDAAFVALSGPGRVLRVEEGRDAVTWHEAGADTLISSLAADAAGGIYYGLSPQGTVHHATAAGAGESLFETGARFVWAISARAGGTLWVGTGMPGRLLRRAPDGTVEEMFDTGDDPVRCIAPLPDGGLVFGTGGRGRVIRVGSDGAVFVLLDAEETEIVSLVVDAAGVVHALAARGPKLPASPKTEQAQTNGAADYSVRVVATPPPDADGEQAPPETPPAPNPAAQPTRLQSPAGAAIYRIAPDGSSRKIWERTHAMPFALADGGDGRLLVATGDSGRIFVVDAEGRSSRLLRIASDQASSLIRGPNGSVWVGGTTDARVERFGPVMRSEGSYVSPPIDAGGSADWGTVQWEAGVPPGGDLSVDVRLGNTAEPDETWTGWMALAVDGRTADAGSVGPPARWAQVRIGMTSGGTVSPILRKLELFYQPRNRPPTIGSLSVENAGVAWVLAPTQSSNRFGPLVVSDPVARSVTAELSKRSRAGSPIRKSYEAGARTISWDVTDPDDDRTTCSLEIRGEGDAIWFPLVDGLDDSFYSWDVRAMSDGPYRVRLTASDATDNAEDRALNSSRVSDVFVIDNTRPRADGFEVAQARDEIVVEFDARDPGGGVAAVEVAIDGGSYRPVTPLDGVADSELERCRVSIPRIDGDSSRAPRFLAVRVTDGAGNLGGEWKRID